MTVDPPEDQTKGTFPQWLLVLGDLLPRHLPVIHYVDLRLK